MERVHVGHFYIAFSDILYVAAHTCNFLKSRACDGLLVTAKGLYVNKDIRVSKVFSLFSEKVLMLKTSVQLTCYGSKLTIVNFKLIYSYAIYCALVIPSLVC